MQILKSMFVSAYLMLSTAVTGYAVWKLRDGGSPLAWVGVVLTTVPILGVVSWLMVFRPTPRTSARLPMVNLLGALGTGMATWAWLASGGDPRAPGLAGGAWLGFIAYAYWYSRLDRPGSRLAIGSRLPLFHVQDTDLNMVSSEQLTDRPAVLLFYRGNWCPLCMGQIKELAARHQDFAALGVRVALISPQPLAKTVTLAQSHDVEFEFLSDEGNGAARALGIADPHGLPMGMQMLGYASETVLPTVIITDQRGIIVWTHETDNYRIRPDPDLYLEILRKRGLVRRAA